MLIDGDLQFFLELLVEHLILKTKFRAAEERGIKIAKAHNERTNINTSSIINYTYYITLQANVC